MKRLVTLLAACSLAGAAAAAPTYRVLLLPLPAGALQTAGKASNDAGDTVGTFYDGRSYRGVVWPASGSAPRLLDDLTPGDGTNDSVAPYDIDAAGQVVGSIDAPDYVAGVAVIWSPSGQATRLSDFKAGSRSTAYAISPSGIVVGAAAPPRRNEHAFTWTPGAGLQLVPVTVPGPVWRKSSDALDINAGGTIVGVLSYLVGQELSQYAWVQEPGQPAVFIAPQSGGSLMTARAINAQGLVVGYETVGVGALSFAWSSTGGYVPLGTLPDGTAFYAADVNDANEVIGSWTHAKPRGGTDYRSYRWSPADGMLDLASLIDPADPLKAVAESKMYVSKINGNGVVTVTLDLSATAEPQQRAALLVPVR